MPDTTRGLQLTREDVGWYDYAKYGSDEFFFCLGQVDAEQLAGASDRYHGQETDCLPDPVSKRMLVGCSAPGEVEDTGRGETVLA